MKLQLLLVLSFLISSVARADFKEDFLKYSSTGNLEELDVLINDALDSGESVNFNIANEQGNTALILAAWNSQAEVIKYLMQYRKNGLDLNIENIHNDTALSISTYKQCIECAKTLVKNGAALNNIGKEKKNALLILFDQGIYGIDIKEFEGLAIFLVNNGSDLLVKDKNGNTLLNIASIYKLHDFAKLLVNKGLRINTKNIFGITPLMSASASGDDYLVDLFLKNGAYKTLYDNDGNGPLHYAVEYNKLETVKLLLKHGFDITTPNKQDDDIFDIAAKNNHLIIYDYLISIFPNHPISKSTLDLVNAIKLYDQSLKNFMSLTSQAWSKSPRTRSRPGSRLDYEYYTLAFETMYSCSSEETIAIEYTMDFTKKASNKLYFDLRDFTINGKTDYQIHISSSIDYEYRNFEGLILSFKSNADRELWLNQKNQLEIFAAEILKFVPLTFETQYSRQTCN